MILSLYLKQKCITLICHDWKNILKNIISIFRQYLQIDCLAEGDFIIVSQTKMHNSYLPWLKRTFLKYNFNFHPFTPSYCLHNACFTRQWTEEIFPWKHHSEKQFKFSWTTLISDFQRQNHYFTLMKAFQKSTANHVLYLIVITCLNGKCLLYCF